MSSENQVQIVARDLEEREVVWVVPDHTPCKALTVQGIDQLDLPTHTAGRMPIDYHTYHEGTGECLSQSEERLSEVLCRLRLEAEVRVKIVPEVEAAG